MENQHQENSELNATNLKKLLWETAQNVTSGKINPLQANSISSAAREILRTTSIQLRIASQSNKQVPENLEKFNS